MSQPSSRKLAILSRRAVVAGLVSMTVASGCNKPPPAGPPPQQNAVPPRDPGREKKILTRLEPWRTKHRRNAWRPVLGSGEGDLAGSRLGGAPWLADGEPWPSCGTCRRPLQFFLQLQTAGFPRELNGRYGEGLLQLFYCTGEAAGFDDCDASSWEAFSPSHLARRVMPSPKGRRGAPPPSLKLYPARPIVEWKGFADGPDAGEHEALGLHRDYDFAKKTMRVRVPELGIDEPELPMDVLEPLDADCHDGDKLAGWPQWIQGPEYPACPKCKRTMEYVFQVDSEKGIPFMFGDVGIGHLSQCPTHGEVLAFGWACS